MSYGDWLRIGVMILTACGAVWLVGLIMRWHNDPNEFNLREYFTAVGRDKKQHPSRAALGEIVALFATTTAYLGAMAVKPETYVEATAVYGSLWTIRGGFSTWLRSKQK